MYFHKAELSTMTAAWLLPVVAPIVAAASGGIVAEVLPDTRYVLWTILVSYILWGTGFPLAMAVLVIYFHRLTIHKLPPREAIVSVFLPLGPLGQGGFAVMQLGKVAMSNYPKTQTLELAGGNAGSILYVIGWLTALIMWGFRVVWLFFALASITRGKFPINMGWWGEFSYVSICPKICTIRGFEPCFGSHPPNVLKHWLHSSCFCLESVMLT